MPREIYHLTSTLAELLRDENNETREACGENVDAYIEQIQACYDSGPVALAREVQACADLFLADGKRESPESPQIQCRKGCSHCCNQIVCISSAEAVQLVQVAKENGLVLDQARLARQLPYTDGTWSSQPIEDRACLFLGRDGCCQVYQDRPLSCRKYHVISPPERCDIEAYPHAPVQVWYDAQTELFTSAAFTYSGSGFMPQMLLDVMSHPRREHHDR